MATGTGRRELERSKLLDRWGLIQEELEDDNPSPSKLLQIRRAKEQWFEDSFQFLVDLPISDHIWCGWSDIMGPLLETFHSYFNDNRIESPLKLIWKRVSRELGVCAQCICQHHQAQETYTADYESDTISPLIKVLRCLDEERVTDHLKELNERLRRKDYDVERHSAEVVSVMFEVLMFPMLLDDQYLVNKFQVFIEEIEKSHDLNLAGSQQYPGVYALLFFGSGRARAIGLRLAGYMGKLRGATDLEPLQPLLRKYIGFLEMDVLPAILDTSRPRVQLERTNVWLGIKSLLGFLEASAFEDGIVEKYPNFLSIVLNHVSDDTVESSYAVTCLRMSFEMLGCKLWWRTTLSPSVMRNTLLGQCFHTRNEKSHKDIFDLFLPYLQSLESLQDGEHEKQRRHFLYFLLHQVTQSSNFSALTRKNACKIALLIIHRGYKINPPCPPFECGHMWGPSLVNSLKDSSLHSSLRQPAFDLIETILISDVSAMIMLKLKFLSVSNIDFSISGLNIDDDHVSSLFHGVEEEENSCWNEFNIQTKLASRECTEWSCMPMLWFDALIEVGPSVLPITFSKAVFWALSHISMIQPNCNTNLPLSARDWLSSYDGEISSSFGWESPSGSDDGGDGKDSRNSVKVSSMCHSLIQTFKRFATDFIIGMEKHELHKQWTWEPKMAESLIILLIDPDHAVRQAGKIILEHLSKARDLTSQLKFLCSSASSLSAMFLGLKYALKQVQVESIVANFHNLQHLFFIVNKLVNDVVNSLPPVILIEETNCNQFSSDGGFLRQPCIDSLPATTECSAVVDMVSWEKFSYLVSSIMWPFILKCLVEGRELVESKAHQMTFVRLLDTLPIIFEKLSPSLSKLSGSSVPVVSRLFDFKWFSYLLNLGSSFPIIARRWKQCLLALMNILKGLCSGSTQCTISVIEAIVSSDIVSLENLKNEVTQLINSLADEASMTIEANRSVSELFLGKKILISDTGYSGKNIPSEGIEPMQRLSDQEVIVLSDDEAISASYPNLVSSSFDKANKSMSCQSKFVGEGDKSNQLIFEDKVHRSNQSTFNKVHKSNQSKIKSKICPDVGKNSREFMNSDVLSDILEPFPSNIFTNESPVSSEEEGNDVLDNGVPAEVVSSSVRSSYLFPSKDTNRERRINSLNNSNKIATSLGLANSVCMGPSIQTHKHKLSAQTSTASSRKKLDVQKENALIKELVCDSVDDPLEHALDNIKRPQSVLRKITLTVPKRKVIQLQMPSNNKSGLTRMGAGFRRLKPPRLDDWYRPILELDYFNVVGLSPAQDNKNTPSANLKEVPLCFESMEHYVEVFRPLVLEEFKAQLHNSHIETSSDDICCGSLCVLSVERIDDFHLVRGRPEDSESASSKGCAENDLILLTREPFKCYVQDVYILGKVERREKSNKSRSTILVIRFYLPNGSTRLSKVRRLLVERSKWHLNRIMSITPQIREFQALSSLSDIPMLPVILNPVERSLGCNENKEIKLSTLSKPLQNMLKLSFNESQMEAISVAVGTKYSRRKFELCLIQGPPGTGKTRTIVATVSALLSLQSVHDNSSSTVLDTCSRTMTPRINSSQSAAIARAWQDAAYAKQMIKQNEKGSPEQTDRFARGRVLICAQSNAAVDELVSRISEGLYGNDGKMYKPFLVRVGNARTVHPNSLPFFIDRLVEQRLADSVTNPADPKTDVMTESSNSLRSKLEKLVDSIRHFESRRAKLDSGDTITKPSSEGVGHCNDDDLHEISDSALGAKLNILYGQKRALCAEIAAAQSREKKASEESWSIKNKIRKSILLEAEIVVTTLSGCGGDLYGVCSESASSSKFGRFSEQCLFDVVVIDEAAQALEPATLIPLQLLKSNGTRCIMVGDPKQLPATVLSNVASKFLYECSMFERLQRAGHPVIMLNEQYRMHPEICRFPSVHFYESKLLNGAQLVSKSAPFHENSCLGPYMFFDIIDGHEHHGKSTASLSLCNESEIEASIGILKYLKRRYQSEFAPGRIGVLTPYRSQLSLLRSRFSTAFGANIVSEMEFNTVDGFQGREVDILILSTVRASDTDSSSIGFVADVRRMNVALTRARFSLWIFGNARTLQRNLHWAALVKNAKERNTFTSVSRPYDSIFGNDPHSSTGNRSFKLLSENVQNKGNNAKDATKNNAHPVDRKIHAYSKRSQNSATDNIPSTEAVLKNSKNRESIARRKHLPRNTDEGNKSQESKDHLGSADSTSQEIPNSGRVVDRVAQNVLLETTSTKTLSRKGKERDHSSKRETSFKLSQQSYSVASSVEGTFKSCGEPSREKGKEAHKHCTYERSHCLRSKALTNKADERLRYSEHVASDKLSQQSSLAVQDFAERSQRISEAIDQKQPNAGNAHNSLEGKTQKRRRFSEHSTSCKSNQNSPTLPSVEEGKMVSEASNRRPCNVGHPPKKLMETRKRQRDDVAALLSSALISSKKPDSSRLGSVKRRPAAAERSSSKS